MIRGRRKSYRWVIVYTSRYQPIHHPSPLRAFVLFRPVLDANRENNQRSVWTCSLNVLQVPLLTLRRKEKAPLVKSGLDRSLWGEINYRCWLIGAIRLHLGRPFLSRRPLSCQVTRAADLISTQKCKDICIQSCFQARRMSEDFLLFPFLITMKHAMLVILLP